MTAVALHHEFDSLRRLDDGREYWSARDLMRVLDYDRWENFLGAIERAKVACDNIGISVEDNFRGVTKVSGSRGPAQQDVELSRYAAYLVAMNGDPRKLAIAAAQLYFAVQTRLAETTAVAAVQPMPTHSDALRGWAREIDAREAAELRVAEMEPKEEYVDRFVSTDDLRTIRDVANEVDVPEHQLRELLTERAWIYRTHLGKHWSGKESALVDVYEWRAYSEHREHFRLRAQHNAPRHHNNQLRQTLYVTPAGAVAISRLLAKTRAVAA